MLPFYSNFDVFFPFWSGFLLCCSHFEPPSNQMYFFNCHSYTCKLQFRMHCRQPTAVTTSSNEKKGKEIVGQLLINNFLTEIPLSQRQYVASSASQPFFFLVANANSWCFRTQFLRMVWVYVCVLISHRTETVDTINNKNKTKQKSPLHKITCQLSMFASLFVCFHFCGLILCGGGFFSLFFLLLFTCFFEFPSNKYANERHRKNEKITNLRKKELNE